MSKISQKIGIFFVKKLVNKFFKKNYLKLPYWWTLKFE